MVESIQHTHKVLPSISSDTAENEVEVGSKNAKEQKENSQTEKDRQAPHNNLYFIVGDSMLKDVDSYFLTCSLEKKFIAKVRPFSSAKTEDMQGYLKSIKGDFDKNIFILYIGTNNLSTNDSREMIAYKVVEIAGLLKRESDNVKLSGIVPRGNKLIEKAEKVNSL